MLKRNVDHFLNVQNSNEFTHKNPLVLLNKFNKIIKEKVNIRICCILLGGGCARL